MHVESGFRANRGGVFEVAIGTGRPLNVGFVVAFFLECASTFVEGMQIGRIRLRPCQCCGGPHPDPTKLRGWGSSPH